ncbi:MAG: (deoxy)nucleoside triphosphate pyrophosphohydrolase [Nitritalea sp.]
MIPVSCGVVLSDGFVLCAQRNHGQAHALKWEFPGGKIEEGESAEEALKRELLEELNITVKVITALKSVVHAYVDGPMVKLHPFVCLKDKGQLIVKEHRQIRWVKVELLNNLNWVDADLPVVKQVRELLDASNR